MNLRPLLTSVVFLLILIGGSGLRGPEEARAAARVVITQWLTRGYYCDCTPFYFFPMLEFGANLFFTRHIGLTLSFGYPATKLGLNIAF